MDELPEEEKPGIPAWVVTFADLMSLLMCFFVLLLSFSEIDAQKFKQIAGELFSRTRGSGAEVISRKGGAGFAVGIAIRDVVHSIALDQQRLLPISSVQEGCYGIRDVALSVPTIVGKGGVQARHEIDLWPKEVQGLRNSANALRQTLTTVLQRAN